MAAMKAVREQAERAGDDPAAAVRREWTKARKEWDQATPATRRTALAADLEVQRRHPPEQRELSPEAATLADGTPHADPFLAGQGWQAQGGLYVRREAEREREAS